MAIVSSAPSSFHGASKLNMYIAAVHPQSTPTSSRQAPPRVRLWLVALLKAHRLIRPATKRDAIVVELIWMLFVLGVRGLHTNTTNPLTGRQKIYNAPTIHSSIIVVYCCVLCIFFAVVDDNARWYDCWCCCWCWCWVRWYCSYKAIPLLLKLSYYYQSYRSCWWYCSVVCSYAGMRIDQ